MPHPIEFDLAIHAAEAGYTLQLRAAFGVDLPAQPFALPFDLVALPTQRKDVAEWVAGARVARLRGT